MDLDRRLQYTYRIGSDNQYRLHWNGKGWCYEFLAGGVLFDQQEFGNDRELEEALSTHGISLQQFEIDPAIQGEIYSAQIKTRLTDLTTKGLGPCHKHGLSSLNEDGTCEACENSDYPDDFKGTEG